MTLWTVAWQAPLSMGILQARVLEWVVIPFSRVSFWPRDWTQVSRITGRFFTTWFTREAQQSAYPQSKTKLPNVAQPAGCIIIWASSECKQNLASFATLQCQRTFLTFNPSWNGIAFQKHLIHLPLWAPSGAIRLFRSQCVCTGSSGLKESWVGSLSGGLHDFCSNVLDPSYQF